jgi:DNA-binding NarL/FixJ family response regulator
LHRVYLTFDDEVFCEALRNTFQTHGDFIVCGEAKNDIQVLKELMKLTPSLVVMEIQLPPWERFQIAEALKIILPEVPLFLVTEQDVIQRVEKMALSGGIDAVFAKGDDVTSLVDNARAVLEA